MLVFVLGMFLAFILIKNLVDVASLLMVVVVETVTTLHRKMGVLQIVEEHLIRQELVLGFFKVMPLRGIILLIQYSHGIQNITLTLFC